MGEACQPLIPFDGLGLSLLERGGRVRVHAVAGDPSSLDRADWEVARTDYSPRLWPQSRYFLVNVRDAERELDPSYFMDRDLLSRGYRSMLRVPLVRDDVPLGSLIFNSRAPAAYTEDILEEIGRSIGRPAAGISPEVKEKLAAYAWPGNVRELRNAIERAVILCEGGRIMSEHLPLGIASAPRSEAAVPSAAPRAAGAATLETVERAMIVNALSRAGTNKSEAARLLGLSRAQLYPRLDKHGLGDR